MKKIILLLLFALLGATAHAQPYVMKFESRPGVRMPVILDSAVTRIRQRADVNGDGNPDMILRRFDEMNDPLDVTALDLAAGGQEIWSLSFEDVTRSLGLGVVGLMGFFDINGNGVREPVFRSREALAVFPDVSAGKYSADDPFVLPADRAALLDLDGDGFVEMIVQNRDDRTVQVWGGETTGTASEADYARALFRLAQSYPNPFRQSTTIAYTVEQPGPVRLDVYDLLGRRIRTLVEAAQHPPGPHRAVWDGLDDSGAPVSSGAYFYRLHVGDAVTSKQAIRVK